MHRLETENVCNKITKATDRCGLWVGFILICMLVCISFFFFTLLCNRKPVTLFLNSYSGVNERQTGSFLDEEAVSHWVLWCVCSSWWPHWKKDEWKSRSVGRTVMRRGRKVLIDCKETSAEAQTELRMRPLMVTLWAPAPADLTAWSIVHWWSHTSTFSCGYSVWFDFALLCPIQACVAVQNTVPHNNWICLNISKTARFTRVSKSWN